MTNANLRNEDIQKGFNQLIKEWISKNFSFFSNLDNFLKSQGYPKKIYSSHKTLLFKIQEMVEIDEANNILLKVKDGILMGNPSQESIENIFHEISSILNMWRERMPNKNEDLTLWKDLLDQRSYINNIVLSRLKRIVHQLIGNRNDESEGDRLSSFDDMMWNSLKFAQIERTYGFYKTISVIYREENKIENSVKPVPNTVIQELYLKTKESVINFHLKFL